MTTQKLLYISKGHFANKFAMWYQLFCENWHIIFFFFSKFGSQISHYWILTITAFYNKYPTSPHQYLTTQIYPRSEKPIITFNNLNLIHLNFEPLSASTVIYIICMHLLKCNQEKPKHPGRGKLIEKNNLCKATKLYVKENWILNHKCLHYFVIPNWTVGSFKCFIWMFYGTRQFQPA